jgi:26S proteasome regulatory subunit N13
MVRSLGLPEEAGTGIEPFLRAIQDQANRERRSDSSDQGGSDRMETD